MKTLKMTFLGLCALAFFMIPIDALAWRTDVRVRVGTPSPQVRVKVRPNGWCGTHSGSNGRHRQEIHHLTKRDYRVAKRLARSTGIYWKSLIKDRSRGYSWVEIGRMWGVPRKLVSLALNDFRTVRCVETPRRCGTRS